MHTTPLKAWFDSIDDQLVAAGATAAVFDHRATIGAVRESFVADVLRKFLPPAVSIGSGQIVMPDGTLSRQCDLVIYDGRFPFVSPDGKAFLYLCDGVIAVIEVKSRLGRADLLDALNACHSTLPRQVTVPSDDAASLQPSPQSAPPSHTLYRIAPKSFVFGYSSSLAPGDLCDVIQEYCISKGSAGGADYQLPQVVIAGDSVLISESHRLHIAAQVDTNHAQSEMLNSSHPVCAAGRLKHRFGAFASVLCDGIIDRLGTVHSGTGIRLVPGRFLPIPQYLQELQSADACALFVHNDIVDGSTNFIKIDTLRPIINKDGSRTGARTQ